MTERVGWHLGPRLGSVPADGSQVRLGERTPEGKPQSQGKPKSQGEPIASAPLAGRRLGHD